MWWSKQAVPISLSLAIIAAVTAVLFCFKDVDPRTDQHLVFFYLLPTAFVAVLYGSVVSMLCAPFSSMTPSLAFMCPARVRSAN